MDDGLENDVIDGSNEDIPSSDADTQPVDSVLLDDGNTSEIAETPGYREEVEVQEPSVKINEDVKTIEEGHFTDVTLLDKLSDDGTFYSSAKSETTEPPVYEEVLNDIGQLVTYSNTLLVVILVFMLVFMGLFSGKLLTDWWRNRQ